MAPRLSIVFVYPIQVVSIQVVIENIDIETSLIDMGSGRWSPSKYPGGLFLQPHT